jgi:hypothetical protein
MALLLVGCATASPDQPGVTADANTTGQPDGNTITVDAKPPIDAAIDAPPGPITRTLTQTTSQTIKAANTVVCANNATRDTRANNFYRVFDLPALGINSAFTVTQVSFQVEHCDKRNVVGGTCTNVAVRVGTYSGTPGATLTNANMTILASNSTVAVPEVIQAGTPPVTPGGTVNAPITATIPAGQKLLVEVDAPDGDTHSFYMGSNDGGESGFGYILAPVCGISSPTNISSVGTPTARNLLLTVTGTY